MKTFWIALIVFALILLMISANAYFIQRATQTMIESLQALPSCTMAKEGVTRLIDEWNGCEAWVSLSVSSDMLREIQNHMTRLQVAAQMEAVEEFELTRWLLQNSMLQLQRAEHFSISNLF